MRRNVAMHNLQCCHAQASLLNRYGSAYLCLVQNDGMIRKKDETSNTMNLIRNYRNWRRYRETVSELNRLTNRELNDLGISRSDIHFVARKSV